MNRTALALVTSLFSFAASAGILTTTPGPKSIEGINIAKNATTSDKETGTLSLTTVGAGLRTKKVLIAKVKVYVAELMLTNPSDFIRENSKALDSAASQAGTAVQLTFLRGVDADTVQKSFKEALQANHVSLNKSEINSFLQAVAASGDARDHKTLTIITTSSASGDSVTYEGTAGAATTVRGPKGFARDVLSIWLGESADDGVAKLKEQILQPL